MAAIPKKDLGTSLTEQLNRSFEKEYFEKEYYNRSTRMQRTYDINTDTYRSGIETWHARGAEHHLVQQLEERLQKMEAAHHQEMRNHKQEMRNLASQVISMNNAVDARVQHINGFYTWLIETYPETVAQYKALLDLKRLTEGEEE